MLLYKYTTAEDAITILGNHSLRFSTLDSLNTPLEAHLPINKLFDVPLVMNKVLSDDVFMKNMEKKIISVLEKQVEDYCKSPEVKQTKEEILSQLFTVLNNELSKRNKTLSDVIKNELYKKTPEFYQHYHDYFPKVLAENFGVLCLTTAPDDELMWSHYASGHSGVVLEFDTTNQTFFNDSFEVAYSDTRNQLEYEEAINPNVDARYKFQSVFGTKNKCWEYEHEYRITNAVSELKMILPRYFGHQEKIVYSTLKEDVRLWKSPKTTAVNTTSSSNLTPCV